MHRTYMGHLERGEKNLSFSSMVRVANALDVRLAELFGGLEEGAPLQATTSGRGGKRGQRERAEVVPPLALRELATLERAVSALRSALLLSASEWSRPLTIAES